MGILDNNNFGRFSASRGDLFAHWEDWAVHNPQKITKDDEGRELATTQRLFRSDLPVAPTIFHGVRLLDFNLHSGEKDFLRARLLETRRGYDSQPTFLSTLVRSNVRVSLHTLPWASSVIKYADQADRSALKRAKSAASLSVCARAVYFAAIEAIRQFRDKVSVGQRHRDRLHYVIEEYGLDAQRLSISELACDGVAIKGLADVLEHIQEWLSQGKCDPLDTKLINILTEREKNRKGIRHAKLAMSTNGRVARDSWPIDKVPVAQPINYRWHVVCQFIRDLQD